MHSVHGLPFPLYPPFFGRRLPPLLILRPLWNVSGTSLASFSASRVVAWRVFKNTLKTANGGDQGGGERESERDNREISPKSRQRSISKSTARAKKTKCKKQKKTKCEKKRKKEKKRHPPRANVCIFYTQTNSERHLQAKKWSCTKQYLHPGLKQMSQHRFFRWYSVGASQYFLSGEVPSVATRGQ